MSGGGGSRETAAESARHGAAVRARLVAVAGADYEIVRELGHGGMGWVFLARDRRLGRLAALKVLPPLAALRATSLERFQREAETAARLTHPNIVPVYGAGGDADTPFYAMAYIEGETLAERLGHGPALGTDEALRIVREAGAALAFAHRHGVIHRDIKPSNVLLESAEGRVLVCDFGLARSADAPTAEAITDSGAVLGTPGYMAPEQAVGTRHVDARADVYGLGVLLFEMLAARRFEELGEWPVEPGLARAALAAARPDLAPELADVVARAIEPHRDARYPSVEAFLAALGAAAAPRRFRRAARYTWHVLAVLVVLALGRIGWLVTRHGGEPAPRPAPGRRLALMPFAGDSAAAAALLPMLRYELGSLATVRLADPRVFAPAPGADLSGEEVREAARRAGAGWIVHGLVAPAGGGRFEILLRGLDVRGGRSFELGRDTVAGITIAAADSVVLRLARSRVGRAVGLASASGAPVSLDAVRAFAAGEDAFGRGNYALAAREYSRVVELDPRFALARYKAFLAAVQEEPTEPALRAAVADLHRTAPAVGPLEQQLLTAYLVLFDSGDVAGADRRIAALVRQDSTFLDGWYGLGELRFHFGALAGMPADSAEAAFRRVLSLWPDAAPAVMHLVPLDIWAGRGDSAQEHMARYLAADSTSAVGRTIQLGRRALYGTLAEKLATGDSVPRLPDRVLEFGAIMGATVARDRADLATVRRALEGLTAAARPLAVRSEGARFLVLSWIAEGRFDEARRELARLRATLPGDAELRGAAALIDALQHPPAVRDTAREIARLTAIAGRVDAPHVPFGLAATHWPERFRLAQLLLARGDTAGALARLTAQDFLAAFSDQAVRGPAWLMKGRILAERGDPRSATRYFRRSYNLLVYADPPWDAVRDSAAAELAKLGVQP